MMSVSDCDMTYDDDTAAADALTTLQSSALPSPSLSIPLPGQSRNDREGGVPRRTNVTHSILFSCVLLSFLCRYLVCGRW